MFQIEKFLLSHMANMPSKKKPRAKSTGTTELVDELLPASIILENVSGNIRGLVFSRDWK
jgi:hypothetical protein